MALLHRATLVPSKLELLGAYLVGQPFTTDADCVDLVALGAYRFDDPAGAVGIESHVVVGGTGKTLHMPLTYRAEPLDVSDDWFVGTVDHSVLGKRWVYNGCIDPVYAQELVRVLIAGGTQVDQYFETDAGREYREPSIIAEGSGTDRPVPVVESVTANHRANDTRIKAGGLTIVLRHILDQPTPARPIATLAGTWADQTDPVVFAYF